VSRAPLITISLRRSKGEDVPSDQGCTGNYCESIIAYGTNVNSSMSLIKTLKMIMLKRLWKKEYGSVIFFERMHE
jgi:hypothetical protein